MACNFESAFCPSDADAKDFTVKLCNYAKTDNIQLKSGDETLKAGDDYTFNAETGELTVKAAYFQRIMFSKEGVLSVSRTLETVTPSGKAKVASLTLPLVAKAMRESFILDDV